MIKYDRNGGEVMDPGMRRREFLQLAAVGGALCLSGSSLWVFGTKAKGSRLISPGCRKTKVKVARLYMGTSHGLWPKPNLDFQKEIRFYESEFSKLKDELSDVDFVVDELVTSPEQVGRIKNKLKNVDGILAIHFNIGIRPILNEILRVGQPTMVFAVPYSGHGWVGFGDLLKQPLGAKMECILSSDLQQLAVAFSEYTAGVKGKFGTDIKQIDLKRMLDIYSSVRDSDAKAEADRWIKNAERVVEPSSEDIFKSCKLALAFEKLMDEEEATVMTVDCYGTMWDKTIKLPAYPCVGFSMLNDAGFGGICESDLRSAMTHILFQGLVGKPGFISDPTVDESQNSIILAHCLGTPKMDGPDKPSAPYKLRTIMERQEGVVPQVQMRLGQKVTQAILVGTDTLRYFTGEIVDTPVSLKEDRGCRTKITVKVDGDVTSLWRSWKSGLHRQTCYGDITKELGYFCRFKEIDMLNESA